MNYSSGDGCSVNFPAVRRGVDTAAESEGTMRLTCRFAIQFVFFSFVLSMLAAASTGDTANDGGSLPVSAHINFLAQHLQFLSADGITHFRYVDNNPGKVTARDLYYKISTRVQINLVGEGTTYIQARGESGRSFASSYDYTGIGLHQRYWSFNLKSLFLGQRIGRHLEAQAGGIEYDWGVGTEATYADNDGWLEGYRLRYAGAGHGVLPDKISATVGYVGDFLQPNTFARLHRMGDENYVQILAVKKLGKSRDLSAEFDSLQSIRYTREAFRWQKLPVPIAPDLVLEAITRASDDPTFGWSANLARNLDKKGRLRPGAFYSDMPKGIFLNGKSQVLLNGDSYVLGKRIGPTVRIQLFKNFEVNLFGSRRLDNTPGPRYRGQVGIRYQFADLLRSTLRK